MADRSCMVIARFRHGWHVVVRRQGRGRSTVSFLNVGQGHGYLQNILPEDLCFYRVSQIMTNFKIVLKTNKNVRRLPSSQHATTCGERIVLLSTVGNFKVFWFLNFAWNTDSLMHVAVHVNAAYFSQYYCCESLLIVLQIKATKRNYENNNNNKNYNNNNFCSISSSNSLSYFQISRRNTTVARLLRKVCEARQLTTD